MSRKGKKPNPRRQWIQTNGVKNSRQNTIYSIAIIIGAGLLLF